MVVVNVMHASVIVVWHGIHGERWRWPIWHWRQGWSLMMVVLPEVVLVSPIHRRLISPDWISVHGHLMIRTIPPTASQAVTII